MRLIMKIKVYSILLVSIFLSSNSIAQHRGDNFSFQGLADDNQLSIKAAALGGAVTALPGELSALFYNPAGLAGIKKIKISVTGNYYSKSWRENQEYRPNRFFATLPFYLEGLYVPDPAEDGMFDHERVWDNMQVDSTYNVRFPELGLDPFSEEAADWKRTTSSFQFNNIAVAVPVNIVEQKFVIAVSFNRKYNIEDFDRNDTFLDPHLGYDVYGEIGRVDGVDTLKVNWGRYLRQRSGTINNFSGGLSYDLSNKVKLGFGFNTFSGSTDDYQYLNRVGNFDLIRENRFRFSYDTNYREISGTSDFSSTSFNIGAILAFEKFSLGLDFILPRTISREWGYTELLQDSATTSQNSESGKEELDIPLSFRAGVLFKPVDNFGLSLDIGITPYGESELSPKNNLSELYQWVDQNRISFGIEYQPFELITLMGGYQNNSAVFVPDGAAVRDSGPKINIYSGGLTFHFFFGNISFAYQYKNFHYYDSYYSNTNYVTETTSNILIGYEFGF